MTPLKVALFSLALGLALASCGGGGDGDSASRAGHTFSVRADTTVTTNALSRSQFLARAGAICKSSRGRILRRFAESLQEQDPKTSVERTVADASYSYFLPGIQFQFDDFRLIGAPSDDQEQVEEMIGAMQFAIESGEKQRIKSPGQLEGLFRVFNELAGTYGLDECIVSEANYGPLWAYTRSK
jgi:hypothetical protein